MAGRGFRGRDAKIKFTATGHVKVQQLIRSFERMLNKLERSADKLERLQSRIDRLNLTLTKKKIGLSNAEEASLRRQEKFNEQAIRLQAQKSQIEQNAAVLAQRQAVQLAGLSRKEESARINKSKQALKLKEMQTKQSQVAHQEQLKAGKLEEQAASKIMQVRGRLAGLLEKSAKFQNPQAAIKEATRLTSRGEIANTRQELNNILKDLGIKSSRETRNQLRGMLRQAEAYGKLRVGVEKRAQRATEAYSKAVSLQEKAYSNARNSYKSFAAQRAAITAQHQAQTGKLTNQYQQNARQIVDLQKKSSAAAASDAKNIQQRKKDIYELQKVLGKAQQVVLSVSGGAQSLTNKATKMAGALKLAGIAGLYATSALVALKALDLAGQSWRIGIQFQRISAAIKGLSGGSELLERKFTDMAFHLSDSVSAMPGQFFEATRTMLSVGAPIANIEGDLRSLAIIATVVNQPLEELAVIYGEIRNKNRLYREDVLQFSRRGIPLMRELEKQLGVSRDELNKMVSDGKIKFENFREAIEGLTKEGSDFSKANEEIMNSFSGSLHKMNNQIFQIAVGIGDWLIKASEAARAIRGVTLILKATKEESAKVFTRDGWISAEGLDNWLRDLVAWWVNDPKGLPFSNATRGFDKNVGVVPPGSFGQNGPVKQQKDIAFWRGKNNQLLLQQIKARAVVEEKDRTELAKLRESLVVNKFVEASRRISLAVLEEIQAIQTGISDGSRREAEGRKEIAEKLKEEVKLQAKLKDEFFGLTKGMEDLQSKQNRIGTPEWMSQYLDAIQKGANPNDPDVQALKTKGQQVGFDELKNELQNEYNQLLVEGNQLAQDYLRIQEAGLSPAMEKFLRRAAEQNDAKREANRLEKEAVRLKEELEPELAVYKKAVDYQKMVAAGHLNQQQAAMALAKEMGLEGASFQSQRTDTFSRIQDLQSQLLSKESQGPTKQQLDSMIEILTDISNHTNPNNVQAKIRDNFARAK